MPQALRSKRTMVQGGKLQCQENPDWDLADQVREAGRDQGEDGATAGGWEGAENASVLPAVPHRLTRQASHVIR
jgi:hypothetical protein